MKNVIIHGDCLEVLKTFPDNSIDSCVTDPPYGLSKEPDIVEVLTKWLDGEDYTHRGGGFMGKTWDSFVPGPSVWREVYRVLKPGAHLLCFAGTRTLDLMAISLRLAGFEIRDVIEWLYFQGFPKSMDVSKAFDRRAGAEREVIGKRKRPGGPTKMIEARGWNKCAAFSTDDSTVDITAPATPLAKKWDGWGTALKPSHEPIILARKPLDGTVADNVERWGCGALYIDGCRIPVDSTEKDYSRVSPEPTEAEDRKVYGFATYDKLHKRGGGNKKGRFPSNCITLEPDMFYSKYFNVTPPELCKKASKKDRLSTWDGRQIERNHHCTVKPVPLMSWLVRLITPPGGTVLDPFAGSGSTLVAAKREGFSYVGIEQEAEYVEIAKKRVEEENE